MPKLLIADGSPTMHRIMALTFGPERIQVIPASDGEQAVSLLPIVKPDIVIADQALAGRSGYEIAAFVRQHPDLAHVPVLLLAGAFEPLDRERAERCGVAGEVTKPFDPAQLIVRVRELLTPPAPPEPEVLPEPSETFEEPTEATDAAHDLVAVNRPNGGAPHLEAAAAAVEAPEPPSPAPASAPPPAAAPAPVSVPARGPLDDYFDRLDAALSKLDEGLGSSELPTRRRTADEDEPVVPTLESLLGDVRRAASHLAESPAATGTQPGASAPDERPAEPLVDSSAAQAPDRVPPASPPAAAGPSASGADLRELMEALEGMRSRRPDSGDPPTSAAAPAAAQPHPTSATSSPDAQPVSAAPPVITDALIDEVTRRVVERLAPGALDGLVHDVLARAAERILREEIAQARGTDQKEPR